LQFEQRGAWQTGQSRSNVTLNHPLAQMHFQTLVSGKQRGGGCSKLTHCQTVAPSVAGGGGAGDLTPVSMKCLEGRWPHRNEGNQATNHSRNHVVSGDNRGLGQQSRAGAWATGRRALFNSSHIHSGIGNVVSTQETEADGGGSV
jgi:hypothetical protein